MKTIHDSRFAIHVPRFILALLFTLHPSLFTGFAQVKTGADLLFEKHFHLVQGKRVGLVTNHTGVLSDGRHLADVFYEHQNVTLVALFGPEHGIRGQAAAGDEVGHGVDKRTGVPAYSLYGATYKPTPDMLKEIEILLFDIQDVGARFYTYISTMSYAMEAAAEQGIPFVVLDRPNPIRGTWVEGFVREDTLRSFVSLHPIPVAHGMTMGELATMFNEEGWLKDGIKANLTVVRMEGWKREMWYDQTGLRWAAPSPNIKTLSTAVVYPGTCLVEGTNLSEGRGTERPFEYIAAPFIDGDVLASRLNSLALPGVVFKAIEVVPREIPGVVTNPKHDGVASRGVFVAVTNRDSYEPVKTAVYLIATARNLYPSHFQWRQRSIDLLSGTPRFRQALDADWSPEEITALWASEAKKFGEIRSQHLLY
ncbi:MAG: DUF1343 domain-containing protein [Ignavibacteriales bacterium]|nr:DUF1343 domain-containing protein [Ignavibacteriales bacterium]